jgi:hypothetical protein
VRAVVAFNKGVFNLVAVEPVAKYVARLVAGGMVRSRVAGGPPIFLTFPTGWRYRKEYQELRVGSLAGIREAMGRG